MKEGARMKKTAAYTLLFFGCALLFAGCVFRTGLTEQFLGTRTVLYKTNIIGIAGPSAAEGEEYIEIRYSAADDENPGRNKTESIMVSPPYIFQNDKVYMSYDFYEDKTGDGRLLGYKEILLHDYEEQGAEYLRIINHSGDKTVEFFFAGGQDMPETIEEYKTQIFRTFSNTFSLPSVRYKKAPVQYLLFPDRKPKYSIAFFGISYTFEGSSCGDITVIVPGWWTL
jgi:hypothetical protein